MGFGFGVRVRVRVYSTRLMRWMRKRRRNLTTGAL